VSITLPEVRPELGSGLVTEVPLLPAELLERIDGAGNRFTLHLWEKGREVASDKCWLPYWPSELGDRVVAAEPTIFSPTEEWRLDEWSVTSAGEELTRNSCGGLKSHFWPGDTLFSTVSVVVVPF
jgi:hypothetical protein